MDNNYRLPKLNFDKKNRKRVKFCPCGNDNKDGKFCPYEGYDDKGYCFSCGETFLPSVDHKRASIKSTRPKIQEKRLSTPSTIPTTFFSKTLNNYERNNFIFFLKELVGISATREAIMKYYIGTSNFWPNATIFWQVTKNQNSKLEIRSGKIIQYMIACSKDSFIGKNCKRNKNNKIPLMWAHKLLPQNEYNLVQCFFGEHLISKDFSHPIAICESEKTAVISSIYLPQFTWIATGSLTGLTLAKCEVLRGRKIILFPDSNGFDLWTKKAKELSAIATVSVSNLIEEKANDDERKLGLDIADYLIRFNYKNFHENSF